MARPSWRPWILALLLASVAPRQALASTPVTAAPASEGVEQPADQGDRPAADAKPGPGPEPEPNSQPAPAPEPGTGPKPKPKPLIRLGTGPQLEQALNLPSWFSLGVSALSQSNTTVTGMNPAKGTSSNLFNLSLQLGPFTGGSSSATGASADPDQPAQGDPSASASASASSPAFWRKISVSALLTQRAGTILSDEIPNILNTQWNYGNGPIARLNTLILQYDDPEGFVSSVKLGKLMQAQDFTVNPIQCYFANFGLCGWAQGTPYMVAIPGNPFNSYGGVVQLGPATGAKLKYGIYQLAPATFAPIYHGLNFRFDQGIGTTHFVELDLPVSTSRLLPVHWDEQRREVRAVAAEHSNADYQSALPPGTLTLGGWMSFGRFEAVTAAGEAAGQFPQNNGVYGISSLRIPGLRLGLDHRVFVSAGIGTTPVVQNFSSGGSAGIVVAGVLANRPFDTLNLGIAYAHYNRNYSLAGLDRGTFTPGTEYALELNYNITLNEAISIMPNLQLIANPGGDAGRSAVVVAGLQVWLMF